MMWDIDVELSYRQQQYAALRQQAAEHRLWRQVQAKPRGSLFKKGLHGLGSCLVRCGQALERRVQLADGQI